jgi:hypothetical protein
MLQSINLNNFKVILDIDNIIIHDNDTKLIYKSTITDFRLHIMNLINKKIYICKDNNHFYDFLLYKLNNGLIKIYLDNDDLFIEIILNNRLSLKPYKINIT